jgi:hypothetical protein
MADEARPASPGEAILASLPVGVARLFRLIAKASDACGDPADEGNDALGYAIPFPRPAILSFMFAFGDEGLNACLKTALTEIDILNIFNAQVDDLADEEALERVRLASLLGATHHNLDPTELVEFIHCPLPLYDLANMFLKAANKARAAQVETEKSREIEKARAQAQAQVDAAAAAVATAAASKPSDLTTTIVKAKPNGGWKESTATGDHVCDATIKSYLTDAKCGDLFTAIASSDIGVIRNCFSGAATSSADGLHMLRRLYVLIRTDPKIQRSICGSDADKQDNERGHFFDTLAKLSSLHLEAVQHVLNTSSDTHRFVTPELCKGLVTSILKCDIQAQLKELYKFSDNPQVFQRKATAAQLTATPALYSRCLGRLIKANYVIWGNFMLSSAGDQVNSLVEDIASHDPDFTIFPFGAAGLFTTITNVIGEWFTSLKVHCIQHGPAIHPLALHLQGVKDGQFDKDIMQDYSDCLVALKRASRSGVITSKYRSLDELTRATARLISGGHGPFQGGTSSNEAPSRSRSEPSRKSHNQAPQRNDAAQKGRRNDSHPKRARRDSPPRDRQRSRHDDRGPRDRYEPTRRVNGSASATMQRQLAGVGYKWKLFCEDKGMENQCFVKAASASGRCVPGGSRCPFCSAQRGGARNPARNVGFVSCL